jgi:flagellar hook assembly protein FlgD
MNYLTPTPKTEELEVLHQIAKFHTSQQRTKMKTLLASFPKSMRCMARIHDNTQCTRKYRDASTKLCGSHTNSLPYGRIDDHDMQKVNERKKGRQSKHKSDIELDQIDLTKYIKTEIISIDGTDYLIDENNVLFENNDTNTIVGRKLENTIEWF